ncbi:hypothetical protein [Streptomyces sp. NPDC058394]|uniref:hypothetical protein n=1 Tax=Streptomyces sp. NPDC058394 TaxID=3346477 RepID=UPI003657D9ED
MQYAQVTEGTVAPSGAAAQVSMPATAAGPRGACSPLSPALSSAETAALLMICGVLSVVVRHRDVSASGMGFLLFSLLGLVIRVVARMLVWG